MSLDVYLTLPGAVVSSGSGVFVRENGATREISREEWEERFPGTEPVTASAGPESSEVYSRNITHNLARMAAEAGVYNACWHPEEIGATHARQLITPLADGLIRLKADPAHYRQFNASNGWGLYEHFVPFVEDYLRACREWPDAEVRTST